MTSVYRFSSSSYMFAVQDALKFAQKSNNTRLESTINSLYTSEPISEYSMIESEKFNQVRALNKYGSNTEKLVYVYYITEEDFLDRQCNYRTVEFIIEGKKGWLMKWPNDFITASSLLLSRKTESINNELVPAYIKIMNFGLLQAIKRTKADTERGLRFRKVVINQSCKETLKTKIREPEYGGRPLGRLKNYSMVFVAAIAGGVVAGVVWIGELVTLRFAAETVEQDYDFELRGILAVKNCQEIVRCKNGLTAIEKAIRKFNENQRIYS